MDSDTVAYANGQKAIMTVKPKDTDRSREELEEEIGRLVIEQNQRCALTDYCFRPNNKNKHLFHSLDRKDSSLGYVMGNLQVATRAANFFHRNKCSFFTTHGTPTAFMIFSNHAS